MNRILKNSHCCFNNINRLINMERFGCYLYRPKSGKLLMIWSSFSYGEYAIGIAESVTG